ncbi:hypothetical protein F5887DRAFT_850888, partial [Amanita rubescens]
TWAARNPHKPVISLRERDRDTNLTSAQRATAKMKTQQNREKAHEMHEEIQSFHDFRETRAKEIAAKYHKKPDYIRALLNTRSIFKPTRAPNVRNAIVHHVAKEMNEGRGLGDRYSLADIQKRVDEDEGLKELSKDDKAELIKELQEYRDLKKKGARISNNAAAQDMKHMMQKISIELENMAQRNGTYAFALATRGHINDSTVPSWSASEESLDFIRECLKMDVADVLRKFELWAVNRKRREYCVKVDTLASMRIECTAHIITGLRCITGREKVVMNYQNYDKSIVLKYKVKLDGWPVNIKFANPSDISTVDEIRSLRQALQTGNCHWVRLSEAQYTEHVNNVTQREDSGQAVGHKRKERSDKGKRHRVRAGDDDDNDEGTSQKRRRTVPKQQSTRPTGSGKKTR